MTISSLAQDLADRIPTIHLEEGDVFYWSPSDRTVFFNQNNHTQEGLWALLHETGHAILDHTQYYSDIELVQMELEAWEKAKTLAEERSIIIDEDHVQDCLDSYRDWLHKRSLCPDCKLSGLQTDRHTYNCVFCHKQWKVSTERFCRPYRRKA